MSNFHQELKFDPERGSFFLNGIRYTFFRPETLSEIQKGVEDRLGSKAGEYLYAAGASWAIGALQRLRATPASAGTAKPEVLLQSLCELATNLGWGRFVVEAWKPDVPSISVRVIGSPFAEAYGQSDTPVCHLLAGMVGGALESLFNVMSSCIENACKTQGAAECVFIASGQDVAGKENWSW
jgi:predicted hydrocarbon binding protein